MEHDMRVSPSIIRKLRTQRGWSQEQLAIASGVSLRTIQRVEAEGVASTSTAVCIAATYNVQLMELQEDPGSGNKALAGGYGLLFSGIAILTLTAIAESGRLPSPVSDVLALINILTASLSVLLLMPAAVSGIRHRQYIGLTLSALGVPLIVLFVGASVSALITGATLHWELVVFGACGAGLLIMAIREFRRAGSRALV